MRNSLIQRNSELLCTQLYSLFNNSKEEWYVKQILEHTVKSDYYVRQAFQDQRNSDIRRSLLYAQSYWIKINSMLLLAKKMEICPTADIISVLEQLEFLMKLSIGLSNHIEAKQLAKKFKAMAAVQ